MSNHNSLETLFHLVHALKQQMHKQIEALNLTVTPMHVRAITIIAEQTPCTASDVAKFLNRDKAQITRLLSALISENLILKAANEKDKRSQCLLLTEQGECLLKQVKEVEKNIFNKMSKDISEEKLAEFQQMTRLLTGNLME
ncbi:MarR family winged helix-turn-helix transcriptional regulator [Marinomonas pollencensis]|uniref:MarR family transcriptional regulator n=1 Tax=Marinomonas pollencensis TaxID=491954 RepID=A0A3E0DT32_9GAMM|nr:MarR family transcriptional regulator [Marinomonas pollencensis]REG85656.1 MarR family transcriptional regulator [Marinomonas pollencensis]